MNTYDVITSTIRFSVEATDSDMACMAADEEIKARGLPFKTQRANLVLKGSSGDLPLGEFTLTGVELPKNWSAILALKSDLFARAKDDARSNWDLPVVRSRGALLVVDDENGTNLLGTADCCYLPKTKKGFESALLDIQKSYPTARYVSICVACDSAASVMEMNGEEYQPFSGEATAVIHEFQPQPLK